MDNFKLSKKLLEASNYYLLNNLSEFAHFYIEKLINIMTTYINTDFRIGSIEFADSIKELKGVSQELKGYYNVTTIINGDLSAFQDLYPDFSESFNDYNLLLQALVTDFLSLVNGLFVTNIYKTTNHDIVLSEPKQNGNYTIDHASFQSILVIPIIFTSGTVKFILCE